MSATPAASCGEDREKASSGFKMAKAGRLNGDGSPAFSPVSSFVSTAESLVSLPAAGSVKMTPTGRLFLSFTLPDQKSQMSVSGFAVPCAMAFAVSMTLPPPTARRKSASKSIASRTASRANERRGFGRTPPRTENARPAAVMTRSTRASSPLLMTLPPP